VYIDVSMKGQPLGRIVINLDHNTTPKTCALFVRLVTHARQGCGLRNTRFSVVNTEKGYCVGGYVPRDTTKGTPGGCGLMFEKLLCENYTRKHNERGLVSMMDCNNVGFVDSRFVIHTKPDLGADGVHVVFGKVTEESLPVLDVIMQYNNGGGGLFGGTSTCNVDVVIFDCGVVR
jgi:cyclophilin family peptidyl-prolyl cis-trans isomerase